MTENVEIWQVSLDRSREEAAYLGSLLSPEEKRRTEAFHFEKDRRRYTVARGALRAILADRLGTSPQDLRFARGPHGKPCLSGGPGFNLSHSEELALIALAEDGRAVGVDLERVRLLRESSSLEGRYFRAEEREFLAAAVPSEKPRAFLTLWTRREAAAKALGLDLQAALAKVKVPLYAAGGWVLAELGGGTPWRIQDLSLVPGYVGALCAQGNTCEVLLRFYTPALR